MLEREEIESAREGGATFEEIGRALGVSRQAVHAKLKRFNEWLMLPPLGAPDVLETLAPLVTLLA